MERPQQLTSLDIVCANIARSGPVHLARSGAHDDRVFENAARGSGLNCVDRLRIAAQTLFEVDAAIVAEGIDRDSGACVDLLQIVVDRENEPAVGAVLTLPIIEAAVGGSGFGRMRPDLASGCGIERFDCAVFPDEIHHIVDDQRTE